MPDLEESESDLCLNCLFIWFIHMQCAEICVQEKVCVTILQMYFSLNLYLGKIFKQSSRKGSVFFQTELLTVFLFLDKNTGSGYLLEVP